MNPDRTYDTTDAEQFPCAICGAESSGAHDELAHVYHDRDEARRDLAALRADIASSPALAAEAARAESGERPPLFSIYWHKHEIDFGVNGGIAELTFEQMTTVREMLVVGIGTMEGMWRREIERRNPPASALSAGAPPDAEKGGPRGK